MRMCKILQKGVLLCRCTGDLDRAKELGRELNELSEMVRYDEIAYIAYKNTCARFANSSLSLLSFLFF